MGTILGLFVLYMFYKAFIQHQQEKSGNSERNNCVCPYCNRKYNIEDGYYYCECGKHFRKEDNEVFKENETVDELMRNFVILMAYISKADGVVTQNEISVVNQVLENNEYEKQQVKWAAKLFNKYKNYSYQKGVIYVMSKLILDNEDGNSVKEYILHWALMVALADGDISYEQDLIISDIVSVFEISLAKYEEARENIKGNGANQNGKGDELSYYDILGLKPGASKEEIKRAYKKLMKIYHPDMQSSKDIPEEIMKDISEKCVKIQEAYEFLMNS